MTRKRTRADVIRGIQEVGYLREIDTFELINPPLEIEHHDFHTFMFRCGHSTGIILNLRITPHRRTRIMEFLELVVGGVTLDVDWWLCESPHPYRFSGKRGPEFPWDCVLNHHVGEEGLLQPGNPVEGYLVGRTLTTLPLSFYDGLDSPASLSIDTGTGEVCPAELSLRFDHSISVPVQRGQSSLRDPVYPSRTEQPEADRPVAADALRTALIPIEKTYLLKP